MSYWIEFKGLRKTVTRDRKTKAEADELLAYLSRHGIKAKSGTYRSDGQKSRRKQTA